MDNRYFRINEKSKITEDVLGCKIDKGIRELIVLLNYHYIGTTASCWGHLTHGLPYPWFEIDLKYFENIKPFVINLPLEFDNYYKTTIRVQPVFKNLIDGRKIFKYLKNNLKNGII